MSATLLITMHVTTQRGWHGGEEQAWLLVRGLRERGHRSIVVARGDGEPASRFAREGFEVVRFSGRGRGIGALRTIRRALRTTQPHIIHAHDSHAVTAMAMASIGCRVPARIAARRVIFPVRSAWLYRRGCDRVIAVSGAVARICRESGIPDGMLRIVNCGVDPQRIADGERGRGRRALGADDQTRLILSVASLTPAKGHEDLLSALPDVRGRIPECHLALAGDGELRAALQEQASGLGIADIVSFLGYRSDVPDLLRAADLVVLASRHEGLGSTLIDAMLAGAPLVATTAGGIPEVLGATGPGVDPVGLLVRPADPAALGSAIVEALSLPQESAQRAQRARSRALERFTADRMVDETLAVYREALEQHPGS